MGHGRREKGCGGPERVATLEELHPEVTEDAVPRRTRAAHTNVRVPRVALDGVPDPREPLGGPLEPLEEVSVVVNDDAADALRAMRASADRSSCRRECSDIGEAARLLYVRDRKLPSKLAYALL